MVDGYFSFIVTDEGGDRRQGPHLPVLKLGDDLFSATNELPTVPVVSGVSLDRRRPLFFPIRLYDVTLIEGRLKRT